VLGSTIPASVEAQRQRGVPDPAVNAAFDELGDHLNGIPDSVLNKGLRTSLMQKVRNAQAAYERGQACTAVNILGAYLNETQALRRGRGVAGAEDLYNRGRALRGEVVSREGPTSRCADPGAGRAPQVSIQASDNLHFQASVGFGSPRMWTTEAGGETWTQLSLPGTQSQVGPPGLPGVPSWQALVALPQGATPVVALVTPTIAETIHINLYPFQQQPFDQEPQEPFPPPPQTFMDRPFVKDSDAYSRNANFPPSPCAVRVLGQYRDMQFAQVECVSAQYNPVTDELRRFDSVAFDIRFQGGDGNFITSQSLSPFEPASKVGIPTVLNSEAVLKYVKPIDLSHLICLGEELLLLTHPNFRAPADQLAQWKRDKGISTTVINVGAGTPYPTAGAIDDLIENRYDSCVVRPSYVLLMGDSEFVPPARTDYDVDDDATTGSDLGYALYVQFLLDVFFPDFGVGRIPVDTVGEAQTVVDKIIGYESNPPFINFFGGAPFYTTATMASYFQCCRTDVMQAGRDMRSFVETSETVRNTLLAGGKSVQRIYNTNTDYQGDFVADTTPRRFWDGDPLPAALGPASGFPWDGDTTDIVGAFNAGRFNILHRDHGGSSGWVDPVFTTGNFASLANGALLPVVYSVNCKSGYFDSETDTGGGSESFMEQLLLRAGGGMVGGLGDVRNSPSWANSALTRGFYDATWPNLAPGFGGATVHRRLGDILNHGKVYLLTQVGVAQPAGDVTLDEMIDEYIMWHAFGDPTLEMWTSNPYSLVLPVAFELQTLERSLVVKYAAEGAELTALQMMGDGSVRPIARAMVKGGVAELPFFLAPDPKLPILLSASSANAVSVLLTPHPVGSPDLVVDALDLGGSMVVTRGEDLAGRLRVIVDNIGTALAPGTLNPDGTIKPGYMVDLVLSRDMAMPPGFAVVPPPPGVAWVEDGLLQGGRLSRTPDVPVATPIPLDGGGVVPLQAPEGKLFLCARVDPGDAVVESDETNNVRCVEVTVVVPGPL
jgi:hypothetical protein